MFRRTPASAFFSNFRLQRWSSPSSIAEISAKGVFPNVATGELQLFMGIEVHGDQRVPSSLRSTLRIVRAVSGLGAEQTVGDAGHHGHLVDALDRGHGL